jgi:ceramide glucosyltransferase
VLSPLLVGIAVASTVYWLCALLCVRAFARRRVPTAVFAPPVSVLKPLCGADPALEASLRSFCEQDYPEYQIVFGVADPHDAAVAVVRALMADHPGLDLTLVVGERPVGTNPKVSNLASAYKSARHDVIVIADSDIRVSRDYLRTVVAPLHDPATGLVTCLYRGAPTGGATATLGAMFVNEWFFPSALVSATFGRLAHAFGATIACRRHVLDAGGGFDPIADYLADDYVLGRSVAARGLRLVLASHVVETAVGDRGPRSLLLRELRWARTIGTARPLGYVFSAVTHGFPLAALALVASGASAVALGAAGAHVAVRLLARAAIYRALGVGPERPPAWALPLRDVLSLAVWATSFTGRTVRWRGRRFRLDRHGRLWPPRGGEV